MLGHDVMERHGLKLGFMSCFVKAAAKALEREPAVNATIEGDEIVYRCAQHSTIGPPRHL